MVFFFQAEDGIRDPLVTGVQTCALPIYGWEQARSPAALPTPRRRDCPAAGRHWRGCRGRPARCRARQIGRASCRERVESAVRAGGEKSKTSKTGAGGGFG